MPIVMTPQRAMGKLINQNLSQTDIVRLISDQGATVSQSTVHRIATNDKYKITYDIGKAIIDAHNKHFKVKK